VLQRHHTCVAVVAHIVAVISKWCNCGDMECYRCCNTISAIMNPACQPVNPSLLPRKLFIRMPHRCSLFGPYSKEQYPLTFPRSSCETRSGSPACFPVTSIACVCVCVCVCACVCVCVFVCACVCVCTYKQFVHLMTGELNLCRMVAVSV
jgi:hypothetical protein